MINGAGSVDSGAGPWVVNHWGCVSLLLSVGRGGGRNDDDRGERFRRLMEGRVVQSSFCGYLLFTVSALCFMRVYADLCVFRD